MTPLLFIGIAAAGGIGSICRFLLDGAIKEHTRITYPIGTTVINVLGSFVLGLVSQLVLTGIVSTGTEFLLGTGLCSGFTTFSTAVTETVRLAQGDRNVAAVANTIGMLIITVAAAIAGLILGAAIGS